MIFKIYDNIFDSETIDYLYGYFRDLNPWFFIGQGGLNLNHRKFFSELKNNKAGKLLKDKATEIMEEENLLSEYVVDKSYASGNIFGTVHEIHVDGEAIKVGDVVTVMFYLNKIWEMEYGGETIFLTPSRKDIMQSVIPKPGRAVLFDGFIPHSAREISRICNDLRMVATIKYDKKPQGIIVDPDAI